MKNTARRNSVTNFYLRTFFIYLKTVGNVRWYTEPYLEKPKSKCFPLLLCVRIGNTHVPNMLCFNFTSFYFIFILNNR